MRCGCQLHFHFKHEVQLYLLFVSQSALTLLLLASLLRSFDNSMDRFCLPWHATPAAAPSQHGLLTCVPAGRTGNWQHSTGVPCTEAADAA